MSERVPTAEEFEALVARVADLEERLAEQQASWPEWMSVETAARYLDCTTERLWKLVARRQIPYAQEGKRCRLSFERDDLDEWMRAQRIDPQPTKETP